MSCGVRYEFSLINAPKPAQIIDEELEQIGTPHDAEEAGPADPRRSEASEPRGAAGPAARGRQQRQTP